MTQRAAYYRMASARMSEFGPILDYQALYEAFGDLNDAYLRQTVKVNLEHILRILTYQRYVDEVRVVCDETNNSPLEIDQGILNVDLWLRDRKGRGWTCRIPYHAGREHAARLIEKMLFMMRIRPYHL